MVLLRIFPKIPSEFCWNRSKELLAWTRLTIILVSADANRVGKKYKNETIAEYQCFGSILIESGSGSKLFPNTIKKNFYYQYRYFIIFSSKEVN